MSYPILAPRDTWFTRHSVPIIKQDVLSITIKDSYIPAGNVTAQWDGSANNDNSVTVYLEDKKIIISGNGSGKIKLSQDASFTFGRATGNSEYFKSCTSITGLEYLDTSQAVNFAKMFYGGFSVTTLTGLEHWDVSNVTDFTKALSYLKSLPTLNLSYWKNSKCTSMDMMFYNNVQMTTVGDLSGFDTQNCISFEGLFGQCAKLEKQTVIENWNVANVKHFSHMLADCFQWKGVLNLSRWDTHNAEDFSAMFNDCSGLEEINCTGWNTSKVCAIDQMFERCSSLKYIRGIENWDLSNLSFAVTSNFGGQNGAGELFYGCSSLLPIDTSKWRLSFKNRFNQWELYKSKIIEIYEKQYPGKYTEEDLKRTFTNPGVARMFCGCTLLKSFVPSNYSSWDTLSVCRCDEMFADCVNLANVDMSHWNTSNVRYTYKMFANCANLMNINMSNWDTGNVIYSYNMFMNCASLERLDLTSLHFKKGELYWGMFDGCTSLKEILFKDFGGGVGYSSEKYGLSIELSNMFRNCTSLTEIDMSSFIFNKPVWTNSMFACTNGTKMNLKKIVGLDNIKIVNGEQMFDMRDPEAIINVSTVDTREAKNLTNFFGTIAPKQITIGPNFNMFAQPFDDTDKDAASRNCVFPSPTQPEHAGADGNWYTFNRTKYSASTIPNLTSNTYYASKSLADVSENIILSGTLNDIGDAIREKTATFVKFGPLNMPEKIRSIQTGNDTSDATAIAADIMHDTTAYIASGKVTGAFTLDTELSAQDSKIAAIKEALKGKGSSGGGGSCGNWSKVEVETWTPAENTQQYPLPKEVASALDCISITRPLPGTIIDEVVSLFYAIDAGGTIPLLYCTEAGKYTYVSAGDYVDFLNFIDVGQNGYKPTTFVGGQTYIVTKCYK